MNIKSIKITKVVGWNTWMRTWQTVIHEFSHKADYNKYPFSYSFLKPENLAFDRMNAMTNRMNQNISNRVNQKWGVIAPLVKIIFYPTYIPIR